LAKAAEVVHRAKMGYYPGVKATVEVRLGDLLRGAAGVVERLRREKYIDLLDYYGIDYVEGYGVLASANAVKVGGRTIEAKRIVIATGARPAVPTIKGLEEVKTLTRACLSLGSPPAWSS